MMKPNRFKTLPFGAVLGLALGALLAAPAATARAQPAKPRVAVLDFQGTAVGEAERKAVTNQFRSDLVNTGAFIVLDRAQTEAVLGELAFQQQGVTDPGEAARIGRLLNVQYIVTGRITRLPQAYQVNAEMIRVETAEIERSETLVHRGDIVGLLSDSLATMAARLARVEDAAGGGPAQEPPGAPRVTGGKPTWPLWLGGLAIAGAVVLEDSAQTTEDDAGKKAEEARQRNDPALFADAETLRDDADRQQTTALALGAVGVALVIYYLLSDAPGSDAVAASSAYLAPIPLRVAVAPGFIMARYTVRW